MIVIIAVLPLTAASGPGFPLTPGYTASRAGPAIPPGGTTSSTSVGVTSFVPTGPTLSNGQYQDVQSGATPAAGGKGHLVALGSFGIGQSTFTTHPGCYIPAIGTPGLTATATWDFNYVLGATAKCVGGAGGTETYVAVNLSLQVFQYTPVFPFPTVVVATASTNVASHGTTACSGGTGTVTWTSGVLSTPAGGVVLTTGTFTSVAGDYYVFQSVVSADNLAYTNSGTGASGSATATLSLAKLPPGNPTLASLDCPCPKT